MELIVVSKNKIKIILSEKDTKQLKIEKNLSDSQGIKNGYALKQIMDAIKEKTGVDYSGKKATVTMFVSKDGGCELFITILSDSTEGREDFVNDNSPPLCQKHIKYEAFNKHFKESTVSDEHKITDYYIVCQDKDSENIVSLCKSLKLKNYRFSSSLYLSAQNQYQLLLSCNHKNKSVYLEKIFFSYIPLCSEYTYCEKADAVKIASIREHCKILCQNNAVEFFSDIFR